MQTLTHWFIRNPVAANLIMIFILVAGFFTLTTMRIEGFPTLPADTLEISTAFPGAYTEQVDRQITQKIEKAFEGLSGVKTVYSRSFDGYSTVSVQKMSNHSLQRLLEDVKIRLGSIDQLPQAADKPVINRNEYSLPALYVQVYGDTDTGTLQQVSRQVKAALLAQPEISKLSSWGEKTAEIRIEVKPDILEKYQLTISDIVTKIQQSSLTFKAGSLVTKGGEISLRADNQSYRYRDFIDIPIIDNTDGHQLLLSDVTTVMDTYKNDWSIARFNGETTVGIEVSIGNKDNILSTAKAVDRTLEKLRTTFPADIKLVAWGRADHYIADRLSLLQSNAWQGLLLVVVILALFLNLKLALWVAVGIPISIAGTLAVMGSPWIDYSLNEITTFGFIIALGILVDDAVVVGESVFEERQRQPDPVLGTLNGVQRVSTATIYGALTSIAALLPLLFIDDALGKIFASFTGVVILALLFSLLESKLLLPAHLAALSLERAAKPVRPLNSLGKKTSFSLLTLIGHYWRSVQAFARTGLKIINNKVYAPLLQYSLQHRYAVLIFFSTFVLLGFGLIGKGVIKTIWFPDIPGQFINVHMKMDARAPYQLTQKNANHIENVAHQINQELYHDFQLKEKPFKNILTVVSSAYSMEIYAELNAIHNAESLGLNTLEIMKMWQDKVGFLEGNLEGIVELTFNATEKTGGGFDLDLYSNDEYALRAASTEINQYLRQVNGVRNLRQSITHGKPELYVALKPEARHLGFSAERLASQIAFNFGGAEAQRVQRDKQEVRVVVQNRDDARNSIVDLMQTRVQSDQGQWLPLTSIATIKSSYATDYIGRRDGKRVNTIAATIDKSIVSPSAVLADLQASLMPDILRRYPQVTSSVGGELDDIVKIKDQLIKILAIVCLLIFTLLAIPLKSYWQPFIIMSVIPCGFVGASIGHLIMGLPLSLLSFFGMLALAGIVINDSLVMITRYNQCREEGDNVSDALINAGTGRFQAIFLTTTTTVVGLIPLINESSESAQYLIPAAVSLVWGEIFATVITLILIPTLIAISIDIGCLYRSIFESSKIHDNELV